MEGQNLDRDQQIHASPKPCALGGFMDSIEARLLKSAKEEFLDKGFHAASTNRICKNAGLTTGALFNRYKNKEELFFAIVGPVVKSIQGWMLSECRHFKAQSDEEKSRLRNRPYYKEFIERIYKNPKEFKLIIARSKPQHYDEFLQFFVDLETKTIMDYLTEIRAARPSNQDLICAVVSTAVKSYFASVFDVIKNGYTKTQALEIIEYITGFLKSGMDDLIDKEHEGIDKD